MGITNIQVLSPDGRVLMVMPVEECSDDLSKKENRENLMKKLLSLPIKDEISSVVFYSSSGLVLDKISRSSIGTQVSIHV